jgi:hypothetical protein
MLYTELGINPPKSISQTNRVAAYEFIVIQLLPPRVCVTAPTPPQSANQTPSYDPRRRRGIGTTRDLPAMETVRFH